MKIKFSINYGTMALPLYVEAYMTRNTTRDYEALLLDLFEVGEYEEYATYVIQVFCFRVEVTGKKVLYSIPPNHPNCRCQVETEGKEGLNE